MKKEVKILIVGEKEKRKKKNEDAIRNQKLFWKEVKKEMSRN